MFLSAVSSFSSFSIVFWVNVSNLGQPKKIQKNLYRAGFQKLFVCHQPTLSLQVRSVGQGFFYYGEDEPCSQGLNVFWYMVRKRTFIRDYCYNR